MNKTNTGLIIYQTEDGTTKIDVRMEDETAQLSLDRKKLLKSGGNK
ncbi:MAG: hypothetical protein AAC993_04825 [Dehalococcoides mccartyi]